MVRFSAEDAEIREAPEEEAGEVEGREEEEEEKRQEEEERMDEEEDEEDTRLVSGIE